MKRIKIQIIVALLVTVALTGCMVCKSSVDLHKGTIKKKIKISSKPTTAMIFINEKKIGKTPFKTTFEYGNERLIYIKAVPLYPNQFTQNIYLDIPPVPKKMMIYMDHQPKILNKKAVTQYVPPERHPEVTITKVDTVFIQQLIVKDKILTPPIAYFAINSVKIQELDKLNDFIKILQATQDVMVDIYGFSDINEEDKEISLNRAKAVFNYFVESGVDATRLRVFGNSGLLFTTATRESKDPALNRKVMFQLYNVGHEDMIQNPESK
jgi:outer membrane protein OmpA-like peptidoglycan-associated protein